MNGFHIDLNTAHFTREYLELWILELSELGYDTIVWELENAVEWDTCPECTAPDAFSKAEFREILEFSRRLGLTPIPLIQTLGHVEYVLKHDAYQHLAEKKGEISQYCPMNPDVVPFVHKWINEYLDLFGDVDYFHIGADETWWLGNCPRCKAYVKKHSYSELYINFVNNICRPLLKKKITPIIWADMVLTHPEALNKLTRKIMLFDWMYDIYRGDGKVMVWGHGKRSADDFPEELSERFHQYLFPDGDEPGSVPETFYTADFLADNGFRVVTCPASASSGDNVISPRTRLHMANTFDSFQKGRESHLDGSVLTSWTVRIHPWEYQLHVIELPFFVENFPDKPLNAFKSYFSRKRFGIDDNTFFRAAGLLSKPCLFSQTQTLHINKTVPDIPKNSAEKTLAGMTAADLKREQEICDARLPEYRRALKLFKTLSKNVRKGHEWLEYWMLAAKFLINRAEAAAFLIDCQTTRAPKSIPAGDPRLKSGKKILNALRSVRKRTVELFDTIFKPDRCRIIVGWMFDSVQYALERRLDTRAKNNTRQ